MTTATLTLTDFLLARIDEAEREANRWWEMEQKALREWRGESYAWFQAGSATRVLAECEAKRRIVEEYQGRTAAFPDFDGGFLTALELVVEILAMPYANHPDYRDEWRL